MKESEAPLGFRVPPRRRLLEFRIWLYSQRLDRDDLLWPAVLNVFELVAFADVRFSSRLRIIGRLGKQRDVVLLDDAEPHAVAVELTLLAYGDPARSGTSEVTFMRAEYGAFMEPRGCNRWQSLANRLPLETAKTSEIRCDWPPPVA
jgi:hypothetical protein